MIDLEENQESSNEGRFDDTSSQPEAEPIEPTDYLLILHRFSRVITPPSFYGFHIMTYGDSFIRDILVNQDEPSNYKKATEGPEATKRMETMEIKIKSMYDNQVQTSVNQALDWKILESKWKFNKKINMDVNIKNSRQGWWQRALHEPNGLTMMRPIHQFPR